jgi:hypothetical protein
MQNKTQTIAGLDADAGLHPMDKVDNRQHQTTAVDVVDKVVQAVQD